MEKGEVVTSDQVIAELIGMGFEFTDVTEAVKAVGPVLEDAVEFILNGSCQKSTSVSSISMISTSSKKSAGKSSSSSSLHSFGKKRQLSITEHLQPGGKPKRGKITAESDLEVPKSEHLLRTAEGPKESFPCVTSVVCSTSEPYNVLPCYKDEDDIGSDWVQKVNIILHEHFGYSSLKPFQKEALAAWLAHEDSLVLAATGSGTFSVINLSSSLTS